MLDGMELPNEIKSRTLGEKGNVWILGTIGSRRHQTSGDERKN